MQTKTIKTSDETELFVRDWALPENAEKRGAVLIIHGLGEYSGRYAHVAEFLNAEGFAVRAFDHRGHGNSGGNRGAIPEKDALLNDAKLVFADFAEKFGEKIILLGHSMGGAIAAGLIAQNFVKPHGLVLSSPALSAKLTLSQQLQLKTGNALSPNLAVANNLAIDFLSHDLKVVENYKNDPLVHNKITPRLAKFILDTGKDAIEKAKNWQIPTILLVAGQDRLVDADGAKKFFANSPKNLVKMHIYDNLYHEIFNETDDEREKVFNDLREWLLLQN